MEEKYKHIVEIVNEHFKLCNNDYSDEEYGILYYQLVHTLKRIIAKT